jgi:hypothetical protein
MAGEPHQPMSPMAFSQAEPAPAGGGPAGGPVGGPPLFGVSLAVSAAVARGVT